jgi:hypothetical protein
MTLRQERRRSLGERWCFVCGTVVPEGSGVAHMHLQILTHQGACSARVASEERVYDRSSRGRWRSLREVLERVRSHREAQPRIEEATANSLPDFTP